MNRRFSKALALLMAVSLCATPAFANTITYNGNAGTDNVTNLPSPSTMDSGKTWTKPTDPTRDGYKFKGWSKTENGEVLTEYTYDSGAGVTFYAIWEKEATTEATVTKIEVKTQPTKTKYTEGETLDLTGLVVTLTMTDGNTKDVGLAEFTTNNITASPANKATLTAEDTTVTLTVDGTSPAVTVTIPITVEALKPADVEIPEDVKDDLKEELGDLEDADGKSTITVETEEQGKIVEVKPAAESTKTEAKQNVTAVNSAIEAAIKDDSKENTILDIFKTALKVVEENIEETLKAVKIKNIDTNKMFAVDISIKETTTYNGHVSVTLPLPKCFTKDSKLLAIHTHDGKKHIRNVKNESGKVTFTLKGLSDIVLVEYTPDESSGGDDDNNNNNSGSDNRYVAYNPGGSSSGGSGGGGGSSSSNRGATSMFNSLTNTINGILKSQLSKGTVGAASAVTSTATAPVSTPATQAAATRAISQAVSKARANGSNSAEAIMQNVSVVSASILESIASEARKSGVNAYLSVDTMKNGIVDVRVRIPVSAASRLGRDVNMASVDNTAVKARFNRYYSNRLDVVALAQNGSFGVPASVAARLALGNANAADLHFYSFNAATNSYQEMVQTGAFIDVNGYLHFNTELGGYIIVSVGSLELK